MRDIATLCFAARPASVGVLKCAHAKYTFLTYLGCFQPMRMEASDSSSHVIVLNFLTLDHSSSVREEEREIRNFTST